jgi:hypothetical protein
MSNGGFALMDEKVPSGSSTGPGLPSFNAMSCE